MISEAMCVLQKYFPAAFFDISVHNMVHLADEALICGPVRYRWMYPFERAMKQYKNIPNNKRFIEGLFVFSEFSFNHDCDVSSEHQDKFATRLGELVRTYCPVKYKSWRVLPSNFKLDVWRMLLV
ncbi:hypothetical protein MKX01_023956 [Papaver californicum]|nr:hypothetical protein MKX01_023956 [Papaver californicum]